MSVHDNSRFAMMYMVLLTDHTSSLFIVGR